MFTRVALVALVLLVALLQYRLWMAPGGVAELKRLQRQVAELTVVAEQLQARNESLERDVKELKTGTAGIEQRARTDFGMIGKDEVFYQLVVPDQATDKP